jgi:hypothetical protein
VSPVPKTKAKTKRKPAKPSAKRSGGASRRKGIALAAVFLGLAAVLAAVLFHRRQDSYRPSPAAAAADLQWAETHTGQASTTALAVSPDVRPYSQYFFQLKNPRFQLSQGLRPQVVLRVAKPGPVHAHILDAGQHVIRVLADLSQPQGSIQFDWDGQDAKNQPCPPGNYLLVVEGPDKIERHEIKILP